MFVTGGVASATGGSAVVSGATLVIGFESATVEAGGAGAGLAAFTDFSEQPRSENAHTHINARHNFNTFEFRLGIYLFSSANG